MADTNAASWLASQSLAAATNDQAPTFDNFAAAIALLEAQNVPLANIGIVAQPSPRSGRRRPRRPGTYLWGEPSVASPRTVFGVPIYTTPQLSTNETQGTSGAVTNSAYVFDVRPGRVRPRDRERDRHRPLAPVQQRPERASGPLAVDLIVANPSGVVRVTGLLASAQV